MVLVVKAFKETITQRYGSFQTSALRIPESTTQLWDIVWTFFYLQDHD